MSTHYEFETKDPYTYLNGFPSYHETEAIAGALPVARNSPQKHHLGLYTEKLSGSAFTAPRATNRQTWLYRIIPSAQHHTFHPSAAPGPSATEDFLQHPTQLRWSPFALPDTPTTFPQGLHPLAGVGSAPLKNGLQISMYTCTASMPDNQAFYSADGDLLIVPQHGDLDIRTELGRLYVRPTEIVVIPRGIRFHVALPQGAGRGYILETFAAAHFELPELGPIGSNGLANPRDFQVPVAAYIDDGGDGGEYELLAKFDGRFFTAKQNHSPFDVVAWHGNYYPMKYDLNRFNTIGTISYDHPDPSIFTVLTVPSPVPGTAVADFVVFPPRWLVGEDTFRPPWFHRNCMSEFMGLIKGGYDGKTGGGFVAGGASLHNVMAGHGPDANTVEKASNGKLEPRKESSGIAFMFESSFMLGVSKRGLEGEERQKEYSVESWGGVKRLFNAGKKTE